MSGLPASKLKRKRLPAVLKHTKDFDVELFEFMEHGLSYDISMNDKYASFMTRILKKAQNLRSFRCVALEFNSLKTMLNIVLQLVRWCIRGILPNSHSEKC